MYTFISKVGRKVCVMFKRNMSTAVLCYLVMMCGLVLAGCGKKPGTQMFTYVKKDDATIEITGFTDAAKEQSSFNIPSEIDGVKVTSVAREAFRDCTNMKEITVSEGVETIGENAFLGCYNLETINFPSTIESVGTNVVKNTI